ncbi:MAG: hypothetical protein AMXMBFR84_35610 [Candidatus Hydrogenedentota bacterium]
MYMSRTGSLLIVVIAAAGCGDSGSVLDIGDERNVDPSMAAMPAGHPPIQPGATSAGESISTSQFTWTTPEGWEDQESTQLRTINLRMSGNTSAEWYVSVLPGGGGGLDANINRWRSQMSLPELASDEIQSLTRIPMLGGEAAMVSMAGEYSGMGGQPAKPSYTLYGAVLERPTDIVFVKMTGPTDVVAQYEDAFKAFCGSIKEVTASMSDPHAGLSMPSDQMISPLDYQWAAPDGWTKAPDRTMRLVTYIADGAECYITVLPGTGGGKKMNIDRWYEQMGQPAPTDGELDALPTIQLLGQAAPLVEVSGRFTDMTGNTREGFALLGTLTEDPVASLFVKMVGEEAVVKSQRQSFITFCESISRTKP